MSNFKPFKLIKDYSKQHPWRFYSILCVVSATAYGELKFRSMRRKELLLDKENEPVAKNEYEQYLISQKKMKENQLSLDEERNKLKQIIDGTSNNNDNNDYNDNNNNNDNNDYNDNNNDNNNDNGNNDNNDNNDNNNKNYNNIEEKKETFLNNTKEKLNQLKTNVKAKKENLGNKKTIKNVKNDFSESIKKFKGSTKKLSSKISKENITEKMKFNKKKSESDVIIPVDSNKEASEEDTKKNNNLSFFHNNNEKFKGYFQRITGKDNNSSIYQYDRIQSSNQGNEKEEEIYDNNQPERMIFLYDVNSQELNKN